MDNVIKFHKKQVQEYLAPNYTSNDGPITILTFNVWFKAMTGHPHSRCKTNPDNQCLQHVAKLIDETRPDLIALQEASCAVHTLEYKPKTSCRNQYIETQSTYLNQPFIKSQWSRSNLDEIVTFWNAKRFGKLADYAGDTEPGRPYGILILKNIKTAEIFALINVHMGHKNQIKNLEKILETNRKNLKEATRIILCGDINIDLTKYAKKATSTLNLHNQIFHLNTQRRITIPGGMHHSDHILDTKGPIQKITIPSVPDPTSDHQPVLATLIS